MSEVYGTCDRCGSSLRPAWFEQRESYVTSGKLVWTDRYRKAVDSLVCPHCLKSFPVDDSFDGGWYRKEN